jgi:hypothetical protein
MKMWNSSPHPISDIRDWHNAGRLEIQPDFQRKEVWSLAAKVMLIDTILRSIPMPKVFVSSVIKEMQVHRTVIDGQQRISSILAFLRDDFPLTEPYSGEFTGRTFSQLPSEVQAAVLQYRIDFNEAMEFSDEELRETYLRLNKYSIALTKQELRRADFPGRFLALSEQFASLDYLEECKIFTIANRRRLADVEFVSEVLVGLIAGPQDKKDSLDGFYLKYAVWEKSDEDAIHGRFMAAMNDLARIFSAEFHLSTTRYRQKADFYSLVLAIDELRRFGGALEDVPLGELQSDLRVLDQVIEPEADARDCRAYAIRCVSQANAIASRRWRQGFLRSVLAGTYLRAKPVGDAARLFSRLLEDWDNDRDLAYGCPPPNWVCPVCKVDIESGRDEYLIGWYVDSRTFQMSNALRIHVDCVEKGSFALLTREGTQNEPEFLEPLGESRGSLL